MTFDGASGGHVRLRFAHARHFANPSQPPTDSGGVDSILEAFPFSDEKLSVGGDAKNSRRERLLRENGVVRKVFNF